MHPQRLAIVVGTQQRAHGLTVCAGDGGREGRLACTAPLVGERPGGEHRLNALHVPTGGGEHQGALALGIARIHIHAGPQQ